MILQDLDLQMIVCTAVEVMRGRNAYGNCPSEMYLSSEDWGRTPVLAKLAIRENIGCKNRRF